jgi:hypothetical protein
MQSLMELFRALESKIPGHEKCDRLVSVESVGWHIQHSIMVAERVITAVQQSDPGRYRWKFNWKRSYVFMLRKIPRGKIKAPTSVTPKENISAASLRNTMEYVLGKIRELETMKANQYFSHPFLGELNVKHTIKFIELHTKHHLEIINEITG